MAKIVGGQPADDNEYPFMVALVDSYGWQFCGASIIDAKFILSAAHCLYNESPCNFHII